MIESVKDTSLYKDLRLNSKQTHAYLFYSVDRLLNDEIALNLAKELLCEHDISCGKCPSCMQFNSHSHHDFFIINQDSIKVEDVNKFMDKFSTLPIQSKKKVFVILNADRMNEIAQNKLLKSLEEPNQSNIFILTTTKTDKLLTTILSRLTKIYIPKLSIDDKKLISNELKKDNIDITSYYKLDFLTDMVKFASDTNYKSTLDSIKNIFNELNSTADIPKVSQINNVDKNIFLPLIQDLFLDCLRAPEDRKFGADILAPIAVKYPTKVILKCLPLIEEAYKMQMSNVNLSYILDNLLFNILKEKFLCK